MCKDRARGLEQSRVDGDERRISTKARCYRVFPRNLVPCKDVQVGYLEMGRNLILALRRSTRFMWEVPEVYLLKRGDSKAAELQLKPQPP